MNAIGELLFLLLQLFQFVLLARVLLSWFPNVDRSNQIVQLLYQITEPVLQPIRQLLPQSTGIDFSPLIVFLLISVLMRVSALVEVAPEILELDLNPVKVLEPGKGAVVLDARMRIGLAQPSSR